MGEAENAQVGGSGPASVGDRGTDGLRGGALRPSGPDAAAVGADRREVIDQLGRRVVVPAAARRIISLCPSVTETLFELGLGARVVGRTSYCRHPAGRVERVAAVGGTKAVRADLVAGVADGAGPDLILAVREENDERQVRGLAERWPVVVLDPVGVPSAVGSVRLVGRAVGGEVAGESGAGVGSRGRVPTERRAAGLADEIEAAFAGLDRLAGGGADGPPEGVSGSATGPRVVYLIWRRPYMAAGAGTYIGDVLGRLGLVNAAAELAERSEPGEPGEPTEPGGAGGAGEAGEASAGRYPELDAAAIGRLGVEVVLAASEPYPFANEHLAELRSWAGGAEAVLVDGELFGWHGSRMLRAAEAFGELVPRVRAAAAQVRAARRGPDA